MFSQAQKLRNVKLRHNLSREADWMEITQKGEQALELDALRHMAAHPGASAVEFQKGPSWSPQGTGGWGSGAAPGRSGDLGAQAGGGTSAQVPPAPAPP